MTMMMDDDDDEQGVVQFFFNRKCVHIFMSSEIFNRVSWIIKFQGTKELQNQSIQKSMIATTVERMIGIGKPEDRCVDKGMLWYCKGVMSQQEVTTVSHITN